MNEIDYDLMAEKVAERINTVPVEYQLWDSQQCADYLGRSRTYFVNNISKRPDFPSQTQAGVGVYRAIDVINWASKAA